MGRSTTPSFILELKLNTSSADEKELSYRFFLASKMKNQLISHARKQIRKFRQDKEVKILLARHRDLKHPDKKDGFTKSQRKEKLQDVNDALSGKREEYGLSEGLFQKWIAVQQHKYKKHIDSLTAQVIASDVWKAAESILFGKGKQVHFQKLEELTTLSGKSNDSGIRFVNGRVSWCNLLIQPTIRKNDDYARQALSKRVKFCKVVRKPVGIRWHYYIQLVLEGYPPKKHSFLESGTVGLDPGVSCEAAVSRDKCLLTEITPADNIQPQCRRLQRKLDRSRRAMNPGNYNEDGTVKKGKKTWVSSKTYKETRMRYKTLRRKNTDTLKQQEETLANEVLCTMGSEVVAEKMNYAALQKKAKQSSVNPKTGRHKSRKRFGSSIAKHAPSRFLNILDRKLGYLGKSIFYVNTYKYRASQYDHTKNRYKQADLNERWKNIRGAPIQRDLYSVFLLMNAKDEETIDREGCKKTYRRFHKLHDICISDMKQRGISKPSVFGF